jgi:adenine phosphoribosyltransferase
MSVRSLIRTIPDYPKPGIQFRDITTLLKDPAGLRRAIDGLSEPFRGDRVHKIVGIEARGFLFGVAVALDLGVGFVPVRKAGKLPGTVVGRDYQLEYGTDRVEMHVDAVVAGDRVLVVDDLIATGGTAEATIDLLGTVGVEVVGASFVIDLPDLGGSRRLADRGIRVTSLCAFDGD